MTEFGDPRVAAPGGGAAPMNFRPIGNRLSRAAFLRGAVGMGAALWACSGRALPTGARPVPESPVDVRDWEALRARLRGQLLLPDAAEYPAAKQLFDRRFDSARPAAVVRPETVDDVREVVVFAGQHGVPITVRGGGHSYVGASAADTAVVLDLRQLRAVRYVPEPARDAPHGHVVAGAGAGVYAIHEALAPFGRTLPLGSCPTVGLGSAFGGGIGVESRRYGLTCDRLSAATLVRADGTVLDVTERDQPDLLWALRGGGGAQVGVVTSATLRAIPATAKDIVRLNFPGGSSEAVLTGWSRWLRGSDRDPWANIAVSARGDGSIACEARLICPGGAGESTATALQKSIGVAPESVRRYTFDHLAAVRFLAGGTVNPPRTVFVAGSDVVQDMSPEAARAIVEILAARSRSGARGAVLVDPLDGAVGDIPAASSAFPWRTHTASLQWFVNTPADPLEAARWINETHRVLGPLTVGGYVNYLEPGTPADRYFGGNLERLRRIRASADPGNRLHSSPALW